MEDTIKVQIPFGGFYESEAAIIFDDVINIEFVDDSGELDEQAMCDFLETHEIDYKSMERDYAKAWVNAVLSSIYRDDAWQVTEKRYQNLEIYSPREYNFENDKITIEMDKAEVFKQIYHLRELFEEDLTEFWHDSSTTRSGFIPFYRYADFEALKEDTVQFTFSFLVRRMLEEMNINEWDEMYDWAMCKGGLMENNYFIEKQ